MDKSDKSNKKGLSSKRRFAYKTISILFPLLLLMFIELVLRLIGVGNNYELFVTREVDGREYYVMNDKLGAKYFTNIPYNQTQNRHFIKEKPENLLRIFALGSSTVVGFPYAPNIAFPSNWKECCSKACLTKKLK